VTQTPKSSKLCKKESIALTVNLFYLILKVPEFNGVSEMAKELIKNMIAKPDKRFTS
jgi:hypothetical protein